MNKGDLFGHVAAKTGLTKAQATDAVNAVLTTLTDALKKEEKVVLVGFGTFSTAFRAARTLRNPRTGEPIDAAAKYLVKFKPGKELAESVNVAVLELNK